MIPFDFLGINDDVNLEQFFEVRRDSKTREHHRKLSKKCQEGCVEAFLQQQSGGHVEQAKQG